MIKFLRWSDPKDSNFKSNTWESLLDEATSALDAESESEVQKGLNRAMKDRTVIIIAHRLATTQGADKIVVFDKGEIIEVGKHIDLLNKKGIYKELCEKQLIKKL